VADSFSNRVTEYNAPASNSPNFNQLLGQAGPSANGCNTLGLGANSLCRPAGLALDGSRLVVMDQNNHRALKYNLPLLDATANAVLGQQDFIHNGNEMVDAIGMSSPVAVAVDRSATPNRVYVADQGNNRVLGYHSIATLLNGAPADLVIGQPDLISYNCNQNASLDSDTLCGPTGVAVDAKGNLYVADTANNRVLEYDSPFTTDTIADRVFGQAGSFFSAECNDSDGPSADTLCAPLGVAIDPAGNLYISDTTNNRVVEYNTPLINSHGDLIFGQLGNPATALCNVGLTGPTAATLCGPAGLATDTAGNLYVADTVNNRVLEYFTPLAAGKAPVASLVFGQGGSMFSNVANNGGISAASLSTPTWAAVDAGGNVYVADDVNNRVLEFNLPLGAHPSANLVFGQPNFGVTDCISPLPPTACVPLSASRLTARAACTWRIPQTTAPCFTNNLW
jgi:sugar lactone lactonase YvrE